MSKLKRYYELGQPVLEQYNISSTFADNVWMTQDGLILQIVPIVSDPSLMNLASGAQLTLRKRGRDLGIHIANYYIDTNLLFLRCRISFRITIRRLLFIGFSCF
jgi:hypothetical protein